MGVSRQPAGIEYARKMADMRLMEHVSYELRNRIARVTLTRNAFLILTVLGHGFEPAWAATLHTPCPALVG